MSGVGTPGSPGNLSKRSSDWRRSLARLLLPPEFYRERTARPADWVEGAFEPCAVVLLVTCFVVGVVNLGLTIAPSWDTTLLVPCCVLAALAGFFYSRRLIYSVFIFKEWLVIMVPMLLVLRFAPYLVLPSSLASDAALWWENPGSFFTASFIFNSMLLYLAWQFALTSAQHLNRLRIQRGELPDESVAQKYQLYNDGWRQVDHTTPFRKLANLILWYAVVLVFLAGLTTVGIQQSFSLDTLIRLVTFQWTATSFAMANVIVYFVIGFLLLSEAQLTRQRTLWRLERLQPPGNLAARWIVSTALVLLITGSLALVLPTYYALTIADLIRGVYAAILKLAFTLVGLLYRLVSLLLDQLSWLFGEGEVGIAPAGGPLSPPPASEPLSIPWLEVIRSIVFWSIALGIVVFCLVALWHHRPPLPDWVRLSKLGRLLDILAALVRLIRRGGRVVTERIRATLPLRIQSIQTTALRQIQRLRLARLTPRQLIEYFYLSIVDRAGRLGVSRAPDETPLEYSRKLRFSMPEVEPELADLTNAFLEARYGPRPTGEMQVSRARRGWQNLKHKLRRLRLRRERSKC